MLKNPEKKTGKAEKKKYAKPTLRSESLTAVAAQCNGTTSGNRKASTGMPSNCNASRLKS